MDDIKSLLESAAEIGALKALREAGIYNDEISQREAYRIFGAANVKSLVEQKKISPIRIGKSKNSKIFYSRLQLKTLLV